MHEQVSSSAQDKQQKQSGRQEQAFAEQPSTEVHGFHQHAVGNGNPSLKPQQILSLQRRVGNHAVTKLISRKLGHSVQRDGDDSPRPRLSRPEVTAATARGSHVRLTFGMQSTRSEAVSYLWPNGPEPAANFFMPDASDPMGSERSGYQWFLILPISAVLQGIRPEVHRMIYAAIPEHEGGVDLPDFVPEEVQRQIRSQLNEDGDTTVVGAWPSRNSPAGLYWVRRRGNRTHVQAAQLPDPSQRRTQRQRETAAGVNRDVTHFVLEEQMSISDAKARVREINRRILQTLLVGYFEAFAIYATNRVSGSTGSGAGSGGTGFLHQAFAEGS